MTPYATINDIDDSVNNEQVTINYSRIVESPTTKYYKDERNSNFETTAASQNFGKLEESALLQEKEQNVLSTVKGVIMSIEGDEVKTKLNDNMIVYFPAKLFTDRQILNYGQQFIYQIEVNEKGYRTQNFLIDEKISNNAQRDELIKKLEAI